VINDGLVYAVYDYQPPSDASDELEFCDGDRLRILRRGDEHECQWWWARHEQSDKEGYVPRNYLGVSDTWTWNFMPSSTICLSMLALFTSTTRFQLVGKLTVISFLFHFLSQDLALHVSDIVRNTH
jgi:hypothetical protein